MHRSPSIPERGRVVLALHGFTGSGLDFAPIAKAAGGDVSWLSPDLPGHGHTRDALGRTAYRFEAICRVLDHLVETLPTPPLVLGYSMGARLAMTWALRTSQPISHLLLVGANPGIRDDDARKQRLDDDRQLAGRIREIGSHAFADEWERHPLIVSQANIPEPIRTAMRLRRRAQSAEGLARSLEEGGTGRMRPLWDQLHRCPAPVTLVVGEQDLRYAAIGREIQTRLPRANLLSFARAGHCAHLEQMDTFVGLLQAVIRDPSHAPHSLSPDEPPPPGR